MSLPVDGPKTPFRFASIKAHLPTGLVGPASAKELTINLHASKSHSMVAAFISIRRPCPVLALSGNAGWSTGCLLSGVNRMSAMNGKTLLFDHFRTC
jgi:hypothetical protein